MTESENNPGEPERLYFVYRADSFLPLLGGWRDKELAVEYAQSYGGSLILGIDVTFRVESPFTPDGG